MTRKHQDEEEKYRAETEQRKIIQFATNYQQKKNTNIQNDTIEVRQMGMRLKSGLILEEII